MGSGGRVRCPLQSKRVKVTKQLMSVSVSRGLISHDRLVDYSSTRSHTNVGHVTHCLVRSWFRDRISALYSFPYRPDMISSNLRFYWTRREQHACQLLAHVQCGCLRADDSTQCFIGHTTILASKIKAYFLKFTHNDLEILLQKKKYKVCWFTLQGLGADFFCWFYSLSFSCFVVVMFSFQVYFLSVIIIIHSSSPFLLFVSICFFVMFKLTYYIFKVPLQSSIDLL